MKKKKTEEEFCPPMEDLLAYGYDSLGEDEDEQVRQHIEHCDGCRDMFLFLIQLPDESEDESCSSDGYKLHLERQG